MLKASLQGSIELTDYFVEIISADNDKQSDEYFESFINLINSKKNDIKKLIIVDTTYLHRHYNHSHANESSNTDWYEKNKKYFSKISIDFYYMKYSEVVKSRFYKPHYEDIKLKYWGNEKGEELDHEFRGKVKSLSDSFLHKGALKNIIKFILDETAGYRALIELLEEKLIKETKDSKKRSDIHYDEKIDTANLKIILSYPGGLNKCISYIMEKYKLSTRINYEEISYRFRGSSPKKLEIDTKKASETSSTNGKSTYSPTFFSRTIAYHIDLMAIDPKFHSELSIKVLSLLQNFEEEVRNAKTNAL